MTDLHICEGSSNVERFLLFTETSADKLQKMWLSKCKTGQLVDQKSKIQSTSAGTGTGKRSRRLQQSDGAESSVVVTTDDEAENNIFTVGIKFKKKERQLSCLSLFSMLFPCEIIKSVF